MPTPGDGWRICRFAAEDDEAVSAAVTACFEGIYRRHFAEEWLANHGLPIQVRALRHTEGWCVFLLLTPWMLARLYLAGRVPGVPVPEGWRAEERGGAPYAVIGPTVSFTLLGTDQKAHLNYHPELGHYLIQPLVQSMEKFASADAVFRSWDELIRTRDRVMEEKKRECGWQREVSRREFLARLTGG